MDIYVYYVPTSNYTATSLSLYYLPSNIIAVLSPQLSLQGSVVRSCSQRHGNNWEMSLKKQLASAATPGAAYVGSNERLYSAATVNRAVIDSHRGKYSMPIT